MKRRTLLLLLAGASHCFAQATFHGNIARTGVYEAARPARLNGAKWTFKTGGPIVASPAVAGGVVQIAILKPV